MDLKKLIGPMAVAAFLGALPLALVYGIEAGAKEGDSARSQARVQQSALSPAAPVHAAPLPLVGPNGAALQARKPIGPTPASYIDEYGKDSESLLVKFRDDVSARVANGQVVSLRGRDMQQVEQVMNQRGLEATPLITVISEERVRSIGERVTAQTGKVGPDYLGLVRFRGERGQVLAAAHAMQALDVVEYVDFEENYEPMEMPWYNDLIYRPEQAAPIPVGREVNAPQVPANGTLAGDRTSRTGGVDQKAGSQSAPRTGAALRDLEPSPRREAFRVFMESQSENSAAGSHGGIAGEPACGEVDHPCSDLNYDTNPASPTFGLVLPSGPFCSSEFCCECVCEIHPACCDEDFGNWSQVCIYLSRFAGCPCPGSQFGPVCGDPFSEPCDQVGAGPGCQQFSCCTSVCNADPFCCHPLLGEWDAMCVVQAHEACILNDFHPDWTDPSDNTLPTPDFRLAQGYLTENSYFGDAFLAGLVSSVTEAPYLPQTVVGGIAPFFMGDWHTPYSGYRGEGYNLLELFELGEELANTPGPGLPPGGFGLGPDPGGGPPMTNLTQGLTVRIAVLFPTALVAQSNVANSADPEDNNPHPDTHEALRHRVTYALPHEQLLLTNSTTGLLNGHLGTAVLGVIGGGTVENPNSPDGQGGMTSVSPQSDLRFYPTSSTSPLPGGSGALGGVFINSLAAAISDLVPGDVINIPYVPRPGFSQFTTFAVAFDLVNTATVLGINVVVAAGDGCLPGGVAIEVAGQFGDQDSGVIIVGGVTPGTGIFFPNFPAGFNGDIGQYHRGGHNVAASGGGTSFGIPPNFGPALSRYGDAIHVSGWADGVAAPGFGTLFAGEPVGDTAAERFYTNRFGGTPAASAMVTGIVANLSGLTKQFYGIPLAPANIRGELATNGTGQPNLGTSPPYECFGAWGEGEVLPVGSHAWTDPLTGGPLNATVVFTNVRSAAEWMLIHGSFDNCTVVDAVYAIRGTYISGHVPAVCSLDGIFFSVRSQGTSASSKPSFKPPGLEGPLNKVTYRSTGQIADILTVGSVDDPTIITSYGIRTVALPTTVFTIQYIELYDWQAGAWQFGQIGLIPPGAPSDLTTMDVLTFNPQRFFNSDGQFLVRSWAYGIGSPPNPGGGFGTGTASTFDYRLDLVEVNIVNIGDVPGDGG